MDFRRRAGYRLARISEEEEEEEPGEDTPMMADHDNDSTVFTEENEQADSTPDPAADGATGGATQGLGEVSVDDGELPSHSDSEAPDEPKSPSVAVEEDGRETTEDAGNRSDGDGPSSASQPPLYQDPPSYHEAVKGHDKSPKQTRDNEEELEWDKDEAVEPNIISNPFDGLSDGAFQEDIELGEVTVHEEQPTDSVDVAETSYVTPTLDVPKRFVEQMEIESQTASGAYPATFKHTGSHRLPILLFSVLMAIIAVLIVVLLPLTFSYVEYYELGLKRQRSTGFVRTEDGVYDLGRYPIGPDYTFKKYPSWATNVLMEGVHVTTTAGLSHTISFSFQYFIKEKELGLLEQRFDQGYAKVIESVAQATLKNEAANTSLAMYLDQRRRVETNFHEVLRVKLEGDCCRDREQCIRYGTCHLCSDSPTNCSLGYHIEVPHFQLLTIDLPNVIVSRNLQVQLMNERAEQEYYVQQEMLTRKRTEKDRQAILNAASEITSNATAQASRLLSLGQAEARAVVEAATSRGLTHLYQALGADTDDHKASLHWLRTLERRERLVLGVSFEEYLSLLESGPTR